MHDGMPYGRNQGQGQGHSREVDRQSPTGLIFIFNYNKMPAVFHCGWICWSEWIVMMKFDRNFGLIFGVRPNRYL